MKPALILIDIQKDYFPGGRMELSGPLEAAHAAKTILEVFRGSNLPLVHIRHVSLSESATFFIPHTTGIEFHPSVEPLPEETILTKHYPNSFRETGLGAHLRSLAIDTVVVTGMMSHMCVDATVRAGFDGGFRCLVTHDACATKGLSFNGIEVPARDVHASFMAALAAVYADVMESSRVISLLTRL
ncbi:MAG TPA: cysteine hydrolase family protein [Syntrophorhabdaceae bacterium]|jgi:nicotinamidase-related amidase